MKVVVTQVQENSLKVGDLVSLDGPDFWGKPNEHVCNCGKKHATLVHVWLVLKEEQDPEKHDVPYYKVTLKE